MIIAKRQLYVLLVCVAALCAPAIAQDQSQDQSQDQTPESRYLVELVIFRHLDQAKTTPEILRPENQVMSDPASGISFNSAPSSIRQLNGTANAIRNLQAYQLLSHLAWTQTAQDVDATPLANLGDMGLASSAFGSAKLYERRFLHLDVQLGLQTTGATIDSSRRIRLNQYYYLDNPDFGVIALVTRAE
jgi:hypothetical protein